MKTKLLTATFLSLLLLGSASTYADEFKYKKLKPADPPCLFLLDEDTGQPTGNAVNPPCVLGITPVSPGDSPDPALVAKFGKAKTEVNEAVKAVARKQ
jgi:hypothetical protein